MSDVSVRTRLSARTCPRRKMTIVKQLWRLLLSCLLNTGPIVVLSLSEGGLKMGVVSCDYFLTMLHSNYDQPIKMQTWNPNSMEGKRTPMDVVPKVIRSVSHSVICNHPIKFLKPSVESIRGIHYQTCIKCLTFSSAFCSHCCRDVLNVYCYVNTCIPFFPLWNTNEESIRTRIDKQTWSNTYVKNKF